MSQAQCWHWDTQVDQASRCSSRCWGPRSPKPLRVPRQPQDVTMWLVVTSSERQVHGAKAGGGGSLAVTPGSILGILENYYE